MGIILKGQQHLPTPGARRCDRHSAPAAVPFRCDYRQGRILIFQFRMQRQHQRAGLGAAGNVDAL